MERGFAKAEELLDHVREYVDNRVTAVKLQAAEKSSKIFSNVVAASVVAAIMLVFAIFISMAGAQALSEWLDSAWAGSLIVAGIWLLVAIIIWVARERLLRMPVMNKILHEMFRDEENTQHR